MMARSVGHGTVLWDVDGRGVASATLNRPEVNNAYDGNLIHGLHEALDRLTETPGLRVVVLRGAGRLFQAGADLGWIARVARESPAENERVSWLTADAVRRLDLVPVPTVALVQGGCFGGGTGLLAACDVVVAEAVAVFSISEVRWGLMAGIILPQLVRAMGVRHVRRYALTGERFDAQEARRLGLVHEVCPAGGLEEAGIRIVDALLHGAPGAVAATKRRALQVTGAAADDATLTDLVREHAATRQLDEATEGLAAFREKRPPRWAPGSA